MRAGDGRGRTSGHPTCTAGRSGRVGRRPCPAPRRPCPDGTPRSGSRRLDRRASASAAPIAHDREHGPAVAVVDDERTLAGARELTLALGLELLGAAGVGEPQELVGCDAPHLDAVGRRDAVERVLRPEEPDLGRACHLPELRHGASLPRGRRTHRTSRSRRRPSCRAPACWPSTARSGGTQARPTP